MRIRATADILNIFSRFKFYLIGRNNDLSVKNFTFDLFFFNYNLTIHVIIESCITSKHVTEGLVFKVSLVMAHTTASSIYSAAEDVPLILAPQFSALKSVSLNI